MTIDEHINRIIRESSDHLAEMSEAQACECIIQAIKSGDFMRCIYISGNRESFTYIPYREVEPLRRENARLRAQLALIKTALNYAPDMPPVE